MTHESGELNAIVNQFTVEASMTLRQVSLDMLLQIVTLGITVGLLIYNFQMQGPPPVIGGVTVPPWAIPLAIVLFAFISPWVTGKLSNKVRDVSRDLQEKMVALNSLVTGAMQSPEEIQAMEAEPMFVAKHDKQLSVAPEIADQKYADDGIHGPDQWFAELAGAGGDARFRASIQPFGRATRPRRGMSWPFSFSRPN